jgi:hypothetical protein
MMLGLTAAGSRLGDLSAILATAITAITAICHSRDVEIIRTVVLHRTRKSIEPL